MSIHVESVSMKNVNLTDIMTTKSKSETIERCIHALYKVPIDAFSVKPRTKIHLLLARLFYLEDKKLQNLQPYSVLWDFANVMAFNSKAAHSQEDYFEMLQDYFELEHLVLADLVQLKLFETSSQADALLIKSTGSLGYYIYSTTTITNLIKDLLHVTE